MRHLLHSLTLAAVAAAFVTTGGCAPKPIGLRPVDTGAGNAGRRAEVPRGPMGPALVRGASPGARRDPGEGRGHAAVRRVRQPLVAPRVRRLPGSRASAIGRARFTALASGGSAATRARAARSPARPPRTRADRAGRIRCRGRDARFGCGAMMLAQLRLETRKASGIRRSPGLPPNVNPRIGAFGPRACALPAVIP